MKDYDVIVIGSGINSLSAAALLSKARKKVLVLEARENIGGMASTVEFLPGYRCNIFNDTIKWINPRLLNELNINSNNLKIIQFMNTIVKNKLLYFILNYESKILHKTSTI